MKIFYFIALCLLCSCSSRGQVDFNKVYMTEEGLERWDSDVYYQQEWMPSEGRYFFREVWTFGYENQHIPEGEYGANGELEIHLDPVSGSILIVNHNNQLADDMVEYIALIRKDNNDTSPDYIIKYRNEHGSSDVVKGRLEIKDAESGSYMKMLDDPETLHTNRYNSSHILTTFTIESSYSHTLDKTQFQVCKVPVALDLLRYVNELSDDFKMPIDFNHRDLFPENIFALSEKSMVAGKKIEWALKGTSDTSYFIKI